MWAYLRITFMVSMSTMLTTLLMYVIPASNGMLTSSTLQARLFASPTVLVDGVPPPSLLKRVVLTHTTEAENPGKRRMSLVLSTTSTVPADRVVRGIVGGWAHRCQAVTGGSWGWRYHTLHGTQSHLLPCSLEGSPHTFRTREQQLRLKICNNTLTLFHQCLCCMTVVPGPKTWVWSMRNGREDIALCTVLSAGCHNCIITQYSGFIACEELMITLVVHILARKDSKF